MSTVDGTQLGWRATSASLRGSSHGGATPNQDAVRSVQLLDAAGEPLWVAAVSDGHGGARYVRSDAGARLAVEIATGEVGRLLEQHPELDLVDVLRLAVPEIVDRWRVQVETHARSRPFTDEEVARSGGHRLDDDLRIAYGATLIVAVVAEAGVAVAQIGDGDALIRTDGYAVRPVPGDARLVAGETTSLCLDSATDDFRFARLPSSADPDLVLLATDGYGNSFAEPDWWHELVGDLATFVADSGFEQLESLLPDWLGESARVGGDDVSAVVLVRHPAPAAVAAPPVAPTPPTPPSQPTPRPARTLMLPDEATPVPAAALAETPATLEKRRRPGPLAALLLLLGCALVVGAVVITAVLVTRSGSVKRDPGPVSTPSASASAPGSGQVKRLRTDPGTAPHRSAPHHPRRRLHHLRAASAVGAKVQSSGGSGPSSQSRERQGPWHVLVENWSNW